MFAKRNYPRAALLASLVFAGWPVGDSFLKIARKDGVPLGEILLICGLVSMATLSLISAARGKLNHLKPRNWKGLLVLGLFQVVSFSCWMLALPGLPFANMYVVSFLAPMAVACMAAIFLKEHLGWRHALAIATGFCGVIVAVNPANLFQNLNLGLPYLLLFGNMIASATQMFLLRLVADKEKSESTAFYSRVVLAASGLIFCLATGFPPINFRAFLAICGSGVLGGLGWNLLAEAYKHAPAATVAPFQYSQIIWGALIGYLLWHEEPNIHLLYGSAIIVASGVYLFRQEAPYQPHDAAH